MCQSATDNERVALRVAAQKELATRFLHDFVVQAWHVLEPGPFVDNWHIRAITEHLKAVTTGQIENLLINVPPGVGKSSLVAVFWPCWEWASKPEIRWMFSSYAESLSLRDSIRCRTLLSSEWYQERWPLGFREDVNQKGMYANTAGGWRMAASVGGKGTGEHPDRFIFDDPHNVLEAESEAERKAVIDWLDVMIGTRGITRGVRRVGVMQRLHGKDASAHVLEKGKWVHLCLPMRYEAPTVLRIGSTETIVARMKTTPIGWNDPRKIDGELLWPTMFPEHRVVEMEMNLGIYHSAGQLQQRPTPRGGGKFKREWFEILETSPTCKRYVRYWDKAGTKGGTGAETATVLIGEYFDHACLIPAMQTKYVILHAAGYRVQASEREAIIKQTAQSDRAQYGHFPTWVEQEPGSGGKESAESTIGNLAGFNCQAETVTGSKEVRADPLCSQASVGKVKMLAGEWNAKMLDELEMFPLGKLKDMVDAGGGAFNKLYSNQSSGKHSSFDMNKERGWEKIGGTKTGALI